MRTKLPFLKKLTRPLQFPAKNLISHTPTNFDWRFSPNNCQFSLYLLSSKMILVLRGHPLYNCDLSIRLETEPEVWGSVILKSSDQSTDICNFSWTCPWWWRSIEIHILVLFVRSIKLLNQNIDIFQYTNSEKNKNNSKW